MEEIVELLQRLINEMISDAKANNRYFTKEYLNALPTRWLMANTHPLYRDNYRYRLGRIDKQIEALMDDPKFVDGREKLRELWVKVFF